MPKLRRLSGKEVISILEQFGFAVVRIHGSHHQMRREVEGQGRSVNVPVHGNKPLRIGTLRSIYKQAAMVVQDEDLRRRFYTD